MPEGGEVLRELLPMEWSDGELKWRSLVIDDSLHHEVFKDGAWQPWGLVSKARDAMFAAALITRARLGWVPPDELRGRSTSCLLGGDGKRDSHGVLYENKGI